jgi:Uma2 family endonuclease
MALAPPPASVQLSELEPAPLLLPWDLRLTPEQFKQVCQANPEAMLELGADGALIAMTPTDGVRAVATAACSSSWAWPSAAVSPA